MKVSNLLFSTAMVRAILREIEQPGTGKTQTRRALNQQPPTGSSSPVLFRGDGQDRHVQFRDAVGDVTESQPVRFAPGDLLYVREAWRVGKRWDGTAPRDLPARTMSVFFEAGGSISGVAECPKDRPRPVAEYVPDLRYPPVMPDWAGQVRQSMFLPRWASRLTLEVTDVRVERLNDISEADAQAEGAWLWRDDNYPAWIIDHPRDAFCHLWDSINGDRPGLAWKYNPWVVAISFRPHLINIDAHLERSAP